MVKREEEVEFVERERVQEERVLAEMDWKESLTETTPYAALQVCVVSVHFSLSFFLLVFIMTGY